MPAMVVVDAVDPLAVQVGMGQRGRAAANY